MSHKSAEDKQREGYPFTARQRRRKAGSRVARKQARPGRIRKVRKSAPRRK